MDHSTPLRIKEMICWLVLSKVGGYRCGTEIFSLTQDMNNRRERIIMPMFNS